MLLDSGICRIYHKKNVAEPGRKPTFENVLIYEGMYARLMFETARNDPTGDREEVKTDLRIRVFEVPNVNNHDLVQVQSMINPLDSTDYQVSRAYHGHDSESGELITDLNLEVIKP